MDPDQWDMSLQERSQRKLLWWIVYVQERWFAATMGRLALIKEEDFDVPKPKSNTGDHHSERDCQISSPFLTHLAALTGIHDETLRNFM